MMIYGDHALILSLTDEDKKRLVQGLAISRGARLYALCRGCRTVIRLNKPIVGSVHLCEP